LVQRVGTELLVCPEDRALPPLRLSRSCSRLLAAGGGDAAAREFATRKVREARSLLRALDRRRGTLVRVMECIVGEQSEFFERGTAFLQPMTLKTVASRLGLHESTVARVVRGKYADTPLGLFPLRHFFSGGFRGGRGPGASGRAVRARIRGLIEAEDPRRPLTDEELVGILETEGLAIARRTVTKYRNNLGIEQARLRRHRLRRASGRGAAGSPA
jgi:RNA polymerase sigma-54 factor